jgi:hypothetical protein
MSMPDPRNEPDYDTFPYGTEPIPGDKTWATPKAKTKDDGGRSGDYHQRIYQLYRQAIDF